MMLFGTLLVWAGLVSILASITQYVRALRLSARSNDTAAVEAQARLARYGFTVAAVFVLATSVLLQVLLQTHRFDVNYVYKYSAVELPPRYLFATFWAGQEGSFLLWAFWTSVLGLILVRKLDPLMERRVMPFFGGVLAFLLLLLTVKSPFIPYGAISPMDPASTFTGDTLSALWTEIVFIFQTPFVNPHIFASVIPADGNGLNPLLENPWMVIHPPTLFLGFASTAVTFAFAISALAFGNDEAWYRRAWPWALFCFAVLGFGVMLGGYWAYDTLGWGGFWGWDPVENGPLVPWLMMVAFLHSVQVQRVRGGLKTTTLLLGVLPFSATLYETFLTRTGILDKFSNHSFSTLGGLANSVILWGLLLTVGISIALLIWRARTIKNDSDVWANVSSREFGFLAAIILLVACALFTGIGMSAPLITGHPFHFLGFGWTHPSSMQADFYNKANFPLAILLAVGMGVGPYLAWKQSSSSHVAPAQMPYALAVGATAIYWVVGWLVLGIRVEWPMLLLFAASTFCLFSTLRMLMRRRESSVASPVRTLGGTMAHVGAAILLLGITLMVAYTRKSEPQLYAGHSAALGSLPYTMTYEGMSSNLHDPENLIKFRVEERPESDLAGIVERLPGHNPVANAIRSSLMTRIHTLSERRATVTEIGMPLAVRKQESRMVMMARPVIQPHWWGDLYFALKSGPDTYYSARPESVSIAQGQSRVVGGYTYTFNGFSVPPAVGAQLQAGVMPDIVDVGGQMTVTDPTGRVTHIMPHYITNRLDPVANPSPEVALPRPAKGPWWGVAFQGMNADKDKRLATFTIRDVTMPTETGYTLEVSTRPFIWLVWLGTILIAAGGLLSSRRRALENRSSPVDDPAYRVRSGEAEKNQAPARTRRSSPTKPAPASMRAVAADNDAGAASAHSTRRENTRKSLKGSQ